MVMHTLLCKCRFFLIIILPEVLRSHLPWSHFSVFNYCFIFCRRDLFGGEGVEVVASTISPMSPYIRGTISPTIELTVRLASIIIKCHSTFNVFPEPYSGDSEPLIQLRTTTTETIDLQEVRVGEDGNELTNGTNGYNNGKRSTKLMLKERRTENSGRKILSIRPAKYERIENWHTPS